MKCIVTSFGSAGDQFPTIALAAALRRRGHDVRFVANPSCSVQVAAAGLELIPAGPHLDLAEGFEQDPTYASNKNLQKLVRDFAMPNALATYRVIAELLRKESFDLVVGNEGSLGAFLAARERSTPGVIVNASPMVWMSWHAPATLTDRRLPIWMSRLIAAGVGAVVRGYALRLLRTLAREVGTSLPNSALATMVEEIPLHLGLWSPLLRGPLPSDPANGSICGFTRSSRFGAAQPELSAEIEVFLESGPAPVVVGLGSVFARSSPGVLSNIAEACNERGLRCLIVGHPSGMKFPANTLAVRYAPYDLVFPRAAAVVVHAGAGTTGEALRAGKPIIAVPFAFDQFGLSHAMEELGVCVRVPVAARSRGDFVCALDRVLADDRMRQCAIETSERFAAEPDGAQRGADVIERFFTPRTAPSAEAARLAAYRQGLTSF
jgi:UDP:flavonoid glycosyltransferase YjiC (YdhE family)